MQYKGTLSGVLALACLMSAGVAWALPSEITATDEDDDATITVTVLEQAINNDARSRCTVTLTAGGEDVPFSEGDTASIRIREGDGLLPNDTLWETSFEVTTEEVMNQRVERTFDCSSNFGEDYFGDLDIYAEAEVVKDECGLFCLQDDPTTNNLTVQEIEDDEFEEDDSTEMAVTPEGVAGETRANRDQDWFEFNSEEAFNFTFNAIHEDSFGRLDVALFNSNGERVGEGTDQEGLTQVRTDNLPAGQYFLRISPRQSNDYNFYDWSVALDASGGGACNDGETQMQGCGNCGMQTRSCEGGVWGDYGECSNEGPCAAGDMRTSVCGNCGSSVEVCSDQCTWMPQGECMDEGECARDSKETEMCEGDAGVRTRSCSETCEWSDFGECVSDAVCEEGELRTCYDGPSGTEGVGVCRAGRQRCEDGAWSACQGQIVPANELCTDARDNDCDGQVDIADNDCEDEGAAIGSACELSVECMGELICLKPPANPQFTDGYCGDDDCSQDSECGGDGVCAEVFDGRYCLQVCEGLPDCRRGYVCTPVRDNVSACVPRCSSDTDCTDADNPICDVSSGICVSDGGNNDGGNNAGNNGGNNDGGNNDGGNNDGGNNGDLDLDEGETASPSNNGGGCAVAPEQPGQHGALSLLLLGLGAVLLRRRSS
jgi:MYXO-CTERM domain-containing protein